MLNFGQNIIDYSKTRIVQPESLNKKSCSGNLCFKGNADLLSPSRLQTGADYLTWKNSAASKNDASLTLFHLNDNHLKYKPLLKVATAVQQITDQLKQSGQGFLKVHSGDYANGMKNFDKMKLQIAIMNKMGIDISTLGNHEFDVGVKKLTEALKGANFSTLVANLKIPETSSLAELLAGKDPKIASSKVVEINGKHYGVVGIAPSDLDETLWQGAKDNLEGVEVLPSNTCELKQRQEATLNAVKQEVEKLQSITKDGKNINKIILVSHAGFEFDKQVASKVRGIDVILGGHSHDKLQPFNEDQTVINSPAGEPVLIFQNGENGSHFGVTDVTFDEKGILTSAISRIESANSFEVDKSTAKLVDDVLGFSSVIGEIKGNYPTGNVRLQEHAYANFVADAMKEYTGADIALIPSFGIRDDVVEGQVTERDINDTLSLSKTCPIIKRNLTGSQIVSALQRGARTHIAPNKKPGILQVSGLKYTIEKNGTVSDVQVKKNDGSFKPISMDEKYSVVYETKLKDGLENFEGLTDPDKADDVLYKNVFVPDTVVELIKEKSGQPIVFKTEDRITVK